MPTHGSIDRMNQKILLRLTVLIVLGAGIFLAFIYRDLITGENLERFVAGLGVWGPLAYIFIYLIATVLVIPGSAITLVGGALFGPLLGTVYTLIGATGGLTLAFLTSRYLAADWVEKKAGSALGRIKAGVEHEGWRFVAFVRLVPLFPFNLLNYMFGLTRIPLRTYVLTSAICILPGTAGYVYLGFALREGLAGENLVRNGIIGLAVIASLVLLPMMVRRWRARGRNAPDQPNKLQKVAEKLEK